MCGLTGFLDPAGRLAGGRKRQALVEMAARLTHRGPDGQGVWLDEGSGYGVAHRRLAVVDLSPAGAQPMISHSGRYVLAFNGEIYNHRALRKPLVSAGTELVGESDTEVLLAHIERVGLRAALENAVGMFALALWDRAECRLTVARDRIGEKPLYYGIHKGIFLFASELKAFSGFPGWQDDVDPRVVGAYLRQGYVPAPWSIYRAIYKLLPGTLLDIGSDQLRGGVQLSPWADDHDSSRVAPTTYWTPERPRSGARNDTNPLSDADSIARLETLLQESVRDQMVADVPVGAMLSGGIDSSAVVAIMQSISSRPVHTFSIGFTDPEYNEADAAAAIAAHLGTEHTELYVTPRDAMDVIPTLPMVYDEPFADVSQIPTLIVSRLARSQVTVSLSGDGGDELFGGYVRYDWAQRIWSATRWMPSPARNLLAGSMRRVPAAHWDRIAGLLSVMLPDRWRQVQAGDKLHKMANVLGYRSREDLYRLLTAFWSESPGGRLLEQEVETGLDRAMARGGGRSFAADMMYWDTISYLPDDILVKLDRASMAVSLEGRVPMLDHRIVEFAMGLPLHMKIRDGMGKWILRQVLEHHVPRDLTDRPKMGFGVPIGEWLRGPLREWAEDLLGAEKLRDGGFLDPDIVRRAWAEHLEGRRNWQYRLWNVLMLQAWLQHRADEAGPRYPVKVDAGITGLI